MVKYKSWHIGILGGGQLAKLTALAAYKLGHRVSIYAQKADEPACQVTPHVTLAGFDDSKAIEKFAESVDVVTLENEFIASEILEVIEGKCFPRPSFFKKFENKISEKQTAQQLGIPTVNFEVVKDLQVLKAFVSKHAGGVLKLSKGGYDGYGNFVVNSQNEAIKAYELVKGRDLLIEQKLNFKMEVSQLVARNELGTVMYPVVETIQENQICHFTVLPAQVSGEVVQKVESYTRKFTEQLDAKGLYCFEYFITQDDQVLFNEMAPRPHNSGHMTMESNVTSQYENLVRAITSMPLGSTEMQSQRTYAMVNLLGCPNLEKEVEMMDASKWADFSIYIYGKKESRPGRKMGHATASDASREKLFEKLNQFKENFII